MKNCAEIRGLILEEINNVRTPDPKWAEIPDTLWRTPEVKALAQRGQAKLNKHPERFEVTDPEEVEIAAEEIWIESRVQARLAEREATDKAARRAMEESETARAENLVEPDRELKEMRTSKELKETEEEKQCREAANEYVEGLIDAQADVTYFRERLPGGSLMTVDQALDFLGMALCRYFTFGQLAEWDVCPLSAKISVVSMAALAEGERIPISEHQWFEERTFFRHAQPSVEFTVSMTTRSGAAIERQVRHLMSDYLLLAKETPPGSFVSGLRETQKLYFLPSPTVAPSAHQFAAPRTVEGFARAITGEALKLSDTISESYGWEALAALLYLLTGQNVSDRGCIYARTQMLSHQTGNGSDHVQGTTLYVASPWVSAASLNHLHQVVKKSG